MISVVERGLNGLNSTANMICDKIKKLPFYTCGGTGGWRSAVYLDMTDPNTNCPSGWQLTGYSKRTCGRVSTGSRICDSVFFRVSGGPYSQVYGKIRAYQYGVLDGFLAYNHRGQTTIDSPYVCGVAVMHGSPRQHIWTFANGVFENRPQYPNSNCPCDSSASISIPSLILLEKITSVSQGMCGQGTTIVQIGSGSTPMTLSGMVKAVTPPVHVALSTILHISSKPSTRQLPMTSS